MIAISWESPKYTIWHHKIKEFKTATEREDFKMAGNCGILRPRIHEFVCFFPNKRVLKGNRSPAKTLIRTWERSSGKKKNQLGRSHTESTQHESTNSPPPLYPMQQKNRTNWMDPRKLSRWSTQVHDKNRTQAINFFK